MKKSLLLACLFAASAATPVLAANANHPYANCDRKVDNCAPTGNETTDQLNAQQLGNAGNQSQQMGQQGQPMMGQQGQPMMGGHQGQPMMGQQGQPMMGQQGQPMMGQQGQPMMGGYQGQPMMGHPMPMQPGTRP